MLPINSPILGRFAFAERDEGSLSRRPKDGNGYCATFDGTTWIGREALGAINACRPVHNEYGKDLCLSCSVKDESVSCKVSSGKADDGYERRSTLTRASAPRPLAHRGSLRA